MSDHTIVGLKAQWPSMSFTLTIGLYSGSFSRGNASVASPDIGKSTGTDSSGQKVQQGLPRHLSHINLDSKEGWAAMKALHTGHIVLARSSDKFSRFGPFFLRENCQCHKCVHPDTKQRTVEVSSIPANIAPTEINCTADEARIEWEDVYPEVVYGEVMKKEASVLDWLEKIQSYGFCFIKGVPVDPESTKSLIERIAFVRYTHYGGFWDFTADLTFKDTAYTNEALGVHTDNTYFTDPARLQLFHLLSHTDGSGGESLLVDGFSAADELFRTDPRLHKALTLHRHPWHASGNEDVCIQPSYMTPVFSIHPDLGRIYQIRWNNYDRAPKTNWDLESQKTWYEAAQCYDKILNQKQRMIQTQLQPGTALIFDNWRMMHGRTEFTGKRRMCGGYVNNDDYISRLRLLKFGRENVLNNLGNFDEALPYLRNQEGRYSIV
ncbi:Trimethyllysine dioxygenase [Penicillium argentinense]|uniref:Trimethyllysine dioxygenase n=1 Tax=Penicillium argentinense TaxID=1131581 RepID=A0A9W9EP14_9EURO|nr:Trimethyllysine dioxygenase [Penicillium argentinense]KAJ5085377.1 Trimethyllysine dioxygenase [Penicillium argentinense]